MLRKFILRLIEKRHYWRTVGFSELAELYANRMMRLMAVNMVSGITVVYMYQLGYDMWRIMLFFVAYFAARTLWSIPSAYFIARVGPKHANLVSNLLYIPGLISLTQLNGVGVPALALFVVFVSLAVTMYNISYHVGFSKVKHTDNAGKEIGFMHIVERLGAGLSPLVGGLVAYWFGPEATMWAASGLFLLASAPLFLSPEPVMTRQHIMLRGFNIRDTWRQMASSFSMGVDQLSSIGMWSLFVAVAVLGTAENDVYAELGFLAAAAFVASLLFTQFYGRVIDRKRGRELMVSAVSANSLLHIGRSFVSTPFGVVLVNICNEAVTSGYTMPYLKGVYDMADSLSGYRIVYIALMDACATAGATAFSLLMFGLTYSFGGVYGIQIGYVAAALVTIPIAFNGFPALRKSLFYNS